MYISNQLLDTTRHLIGSYEVASCTEALTNWWHQITEQSSPVL